MTARCGDPVCGGRCYDCIGLDNFWDAVDAQLDAVEEAKTFAAVQDAVGDTFYGSGGDRQMSDALRAAGWRSVEMDEEWEHHYRMRAPGGDVIEYCEGDISLVEKGAS